CAREEYVYSLAYW
nr:immunoglobulin heavy chain junction region [Mus musculus]